MTKNEIYIINGLLEQAKVRTLQIMGSLISQITKDNEESINESLMIHTKVYQQYDQCINDLKKLFEKEGQ